MQLQDAVKSTASHSECHAGLFTAYQAARRILLDPSNSILKILCSTFQHVLLPSNTKVMAEVHKVVNNGFHFYICDWEVIITCAFHALQNKHFKFDFQTLFLLKSEIDFLPETGSHDLLGLVTKTTDHLRNMVYRSRDEPRHRNNLGS